MIYPKSLLFVPAAKEALFLKAFSYGVDSVIFDLEDSINVDQKQIARQNIFNFINSYEHSFFIRINDTQSRFFLEDIELLKSIPKAGLKGIILPKTQSRDDVDLLTHHFSHPYIIALIETALGIQNLSQIAQTEAIKQLSFGSLDISLDMGLREGAGRDFTLNLLRAKIVEASVIHNLLPPINGVFADIKDLDGLKKELEFVSSMGFGASLCIHPRQIQVINEVFAYSKEEIQWATEILKLAGENENKVFSYKGKMIDIPVIKLAEKIVQSIS